MNFSVQGISLNNYKEKMNVSRRRNVLPPPFPVVLLPAVHIPWGRRMCLLTSIMSRSPTLTTGQSSSKDRLGMAFLSRTASDPWVRTANDLALQHLSIFLWLRKALLLGFYAIQQAGTEERLSKLGGEAGEWWMIDGEEVLTKALWVNHTLPPGVTKFWKMIKFLSFRMQFLGRRTERDWQDKIWNSSQCH